MTNTEIKQVIDTQITNQSLVGQTKHENVGNRMKDIVDYIDQEIQAIPDPSIPALTVGEVIGVQTNTVFLQYGINQYYPSVSNDRAILPEDKLPGQSIYVYCYNNGIIRGAVANTANIYTTAIGATGSLNVLAGQLYRFTKVENGNWIYEIIYGEVTKYKSYSAFLQFSNTTVTPTVIQNDIGANITWSYDVSNNIIATASSGVFIAGKTVWMPMVFRGNGINYSLTGVRASNNVVAVQSHQVDNNTQGMPFIGGVFVEIRIYN